MYAGMGLSATAHGLQSGLRYSFRLLAENDEGKSMWSSLTTTTTAAVPPSSPVGLAIVEAKQTLATLRWREPEDSGGGRVAVYEVALQAKSAAAVEHMGGEWLSIFQGEALACTISSLRPGCTYRARVRAASAAGWGLFSVPIDVVSAPDVPDAPEPPRLQEAEARFLGVEWDPPGHNGGAKVSFYTLEVAQWSPCVCGGCSHAHLAEQPCEAALEGTSVQMKLSGDVRMAEIRDLLPGTPYFFRVSAHSQLGAGAWSDWARLVTLAEPPDRPGGVVATPLGSCAVAVRWTPPNGHGAAVTTYYVEMSPISRLIVARQQQQQQGIGGGVTALDEAWLRGDDAAAACFDQVYRGPDCRYEARELLPACEYVFRVAAANAAGVGEWSAAVRVRTCSAAPGPVNRVSASASGPEEIEVSWEPPSVDNGSMVCSYVVEMALGALGRRIPPSSAPSTWSQVRAAVQWVLPALPLLSPS